MVRPWPVHGPSMARRHSGPVYLAETGRTLQWQGRGGWGLRPVVVLVGATGGTNELAEAEWAGRGGRDRVGRLQYFTV